MGQGSAAPAPGQGLHGPDAVRETLLDTVPGRTSPVATARARRPAQASGGFQAYAKWCTMFCRASCGQSACDDLWGRALGNHALYPAAGWVTTGSTRKCAMKRDLGMDE